MIKLLLLDMYHLIVIIHDISAVTDLDPTTSFLEEHDEWRVTESVHLPLLELGFKYILGQGWVTNQVLCTCT